MIDHYLGNEHRLATWCDKANSIVYILASQYKTASCARLLPSLPHSGPDWVVLTTVLPYGLLTFQLSNKDACQQDVYRPLQWPSGGGVSAQRGVCPGGVCSGGSLPRGCLLRGVSATPPCPVHAGINPPGQNSWHTLVKALPFCNYCCGR